MRLVLLAIVMALFTLPVDAQDTCPMQDVGEAVDAPGYDTQAKAEYDAFVANYVCVDATLPCSIEADRAAAEAGIGARYDYGIPSRRYVIRQYVFGDGRDSASPSMYVFGSLSDPGYVYIMPFAYNVRRWHRLTPAEKAQYSFNENPHPCSDVRRVERSEYDAYMDAQD